jgi:hypothetical protein
VSSMAADGGHSWFLLWGEEEGEASVTGEEEAETVGLM